MNNKLLTLLTLGLISFSFGTGAFGVEQPNQSKKTSEVIYVPGEILVKVQLGVTLTASGSNNSELAGVIHGLGVKSVKELFPADKSGTHLSRFYKLTLNPGQDLFAAVKSLSKLECVDSASLNYLSRVCETTPTDASFTDQWGPQKMDCTFAWDLFTGSDNVTVAIVDSGVDYTHPDLSGNMWVNSAEIPNNGIDDDGNGYIDDYLGWDAVDEDGDPYDSSGIGHGTHVSGIVGAVANNTLIGQNIAGILWKCKLMAVRAGGQWLSDSDVGEAIRYAADNGADVINMSFGGSSQGTAESAAIQYAANKGVILVAAAGNSDTEQTFYPAGFDEVMAVAATDKDDIRASFSNYGDWISVSAPGVDILSCIPGVTVGDEPDAGDVFFDDMESGGSNFDHGGSHSSWLVTEDEAYSPTHSWSDGDGDYSNNTNSWLALKRDLDISDAIGEDTAIVFRTKYSIEPGYDHLYIEVSSDSGSTWSIIGNITGSSSGQWKKRAFVVPDSYKSSSFRFRFRLQSDSTVTDDGAYIDNIGVISPVNITGGNYASWDGTSMASPEVAGLCGLVLGYGRSQSPVQNLTRVQVREIVEDTADNIDNLNPGFAGKLGTGRVDAYSALSMVHSGELPSPLTSIEIQTDTGQTDNITVTEVGSQQFKAIGHKSDGSTEDVTDEATWWARPVRYGTFSTSSPGKYNASLVPADREVAITAYLTRRGETYKGEKIITVKDDPNASPIVISGADQVDPSSRNAYTAKIEKDGSQTDITRAVQWVVTSGTEYAAFDPGDPGVLATTPDSAGKQITTKITYVDKDDRLAYERTKDVTISDQSQQISALFVTGPLQVAAGSTTNLEAKIAHAGSDTFTDVTGQSQWSISPASVGVFSEAGTLVAGNVAAKTSATITVAYTANGQTYTASLGINVVPAQPQGITVQKAESKSDSIYDQQVEPVLPCGLSGVLVILSVFFAGFVMTKSS